MTLRSSEKLNRDSGGKPIVRKSLSLVARALFVFFAMATHQVARAGEELDQELQQPVTLQAHQFVNKSLASSHKSTGNAHAKKSAGGSAHINAKTSHAPQSRRPAQADSPSAADELTQELKTMGGIAIQVPSGVRVKVGQKTILKVSVMSTDLDAKTITVQATAESGLQRTGSKLSKILNAMKARKRRTIAFEFLATEPGQHLVNVEVDRTTTKGIDSHTATLLVDVTE